MSIDVGALVWRAALPAMDKIVLLRLADFAAEDGSRIFPSIGRVCRECGVSDRHVQNVLKKYVASGLLHQVRAGGGRCRGGDGRTSEYRMDIEALKRCIPFGVPEGETPNTVPGIGEEYPEPRSPIQPETPQAVRGMGRENPEPGSPIPANTPNLTTDTPNATTEYPEPRSPEPSLTVRNRHSDGQPSGPKDEPGLFEGQGAAPTGGDRFEEWWTLVPRKVAKGQARAAFKAALRKVTFDVLAGGMRRYAASVQGKDAQYVCHPATWLNGERWADDPGVRSATAASGTVIRSTDFDRGYQAAQAKGPEAVRAWLAEQGRRPAEAVGGGR